MSIFKKILFGLLSMGIIPAAVIAFIAYESAKGELEREIYSNLESNREIKKQSIQSYFKVIDNQIHTLSENLMVVDAMREFKTLFKKSREENGIGDADLLRIKAKLKEYYQNDFSAEYRNQVGADSDFEKRFSMLDADSIYMQYLYIRANQNPLGSKHLLDGASDLSAYSKLHNKFHPIMRNYLEKYGYYDIFLVDSESGDIVYSVFKELDYSTSLLDGPYADTNFADAFRIANQATDSQVSVLVDFKKYYPSYEAPASFIASPIFDNGKKIGVLLFQMPLDRINEVMDVRAGLKETGETYLVGSDLLMRSNSHMDKEAHSVVNSFRNPAKGKVETSSVDLALKGKSGNMLIKGYHGKEVLSSFSPVEILGLKWAIIAEMTKEEAFNSVGHMRNSFSIIILIIIMIILPLAYFLGRNLNEPIKRIIAEINSVTAGVLNGDLKRRCSDAVAVDFKPIAMGVNHLMESFSKPIEENIAVMRLVAGKDLTARMSRDYKGDFASLSESVNGSLKNLEEALEQIQGSVEQMDLAASQVANSSQNLSVGSSTQASNLEEVTSATNEVNDKAKGNADKAENINRISNQTKDKALTGNDKMKELVSSMEDINQSSEQISKIIRVIDEIAFQTNLLALNAAVEAARAGRHGKGFAVVAEEVRNLAARSAKAAQETTTLIEDSNDKVQGGMGTVHQTEEALRAIAEEVEKMSVLIDEITQDSHDQAKGISHITGSLSQIESVTQSNTATAQETASASEELMGQTQEVLRTVKQFKIGRSGGSV